METITGYRFAIDLEDRGVTEGLQRMAREATMLKRAMTANFRELSAGGNYLDAYKGKITDAENTIRQYRMDIQEQLKDVKKLTDQQDRGQQLSDKDAKALQRAENRVQSYRNQISQLTSQMNQAKIKLDQYNSALDRNRSVTEQMKSIGDSTVQRLRAEGRGLAANAQHYRNVADQKRRLTTLNQQERGQIVNLNKAMREANNDYNMANASTRKLTEQLKSNKAALDDARAAHGNDSKAVKRLQQRERDLNKELNASRLAMGAARERTIANSDALAKATVEANKTAASLAKVAAEDRRVNGTGLGRFTASVHRAADAAHTLSGQMTRAGGSIRNAFWNVAPVIGTVTAGLGKSVQMAAHVQNSYNNLGSLLKYAGDKADTAAVRTRNLNAMQRQGVTLGNQYGISQSKVAEGYTQLVKRGYNSTQALGAMRNMLKATRATGDDFNDVIRSSASVLDAFGLRSNNAAKMSRNTAVVLNDMAYAADKSATSFKDEGYAMTYVSGTAAEAGQSVRSTTAAIGALSNAGMEGSIAGTGLRKVLQSLLKPTKDGQAALKQYGMSIDDFKTKSGKLKSVPAIFDEIRKHTENLSKAERAAFAKRVFGATGMNAGAYLSTKKGYEQLEELYKGEERAVKGTSYITKVANQNMKSTQMQWARFKTTAQNLAIAIGSQLMPVLNDAMIGLNKVMQSKETHKAMRSIVGDIKDIAEGFKAASPFISSVMGGLAIAFQMVAKPISFATKLIGKFFGFFDNSKLETFTKWAVGITVGFGAWVAILDKVFTGFFKIKNTVKDIFNLFRHPFLHTKAEAEITDNEAIKKSIDNINASLEEQNKLLQQTPTTNPNVEERENELAETTGKKPSQAAEIDPSMIESEARNTAKPAAKEAAETGAEEAAADAVKTTGKSSAVSDAMATAGAASATGWFGGFSSHIKGAGSKIAGAITNVIGAGASSKAGSSFSVMGLTIGKRFVAGLGTAIAAFDIIQAMGMNKKGQRAAQAKKAGTGIGTLIGMGIGGAIGSIVPGAGTAAGMALGGAIGGQAGKYAGPRFRRGWDDFAKGYKPRGIIAKVGFDLHEAMTNWHNAIARITRRHPVVGIVINAITRPFKLAITGLKASINWLKGYWKTTSDLMGNIFLGRFSKIGPTFKKDFHNWVHQSSEDWKKGWDNASLHNQRTTERTHKHYREERAKDKKADQDAAKYRTYADQKYTNKDIAAVKRMTSATKQYANAAKGLKKVNLATYYARIGRALRKDGIEKNLKNIGKQIKTQTKYWKQFQKPLRLVEREMTRFQKVMRQFTRKNNGFERLTRDVRSLYRSLRRYQFGREISRQMNIANRSMRGNRGFERQFSRMTRTVDRELRNFKRMFDRDWRRSWQDLGPIAERGISRAASYASRGFDQIISREHHFVNSFLKSWESWLDDVASDMKSGFSKLAGIAGNAMRDIVSRMNRGIRAINSVIADFGGHQLGTIKYANGTSHYGAHPGGPMLVNDSKRPLWKEIVRFPDGSAIIPQVRNFFIPNAPAGTEVYNGEDTKQIMNAAGVKHYADGLSMHEAASDAMEIQHDPIAGTRKLFYELANFNSSIPVVRDLGAALGKGFTEAVAQGVKRETTNIPNSVGESTGWKFPVIMALMMNGFEASQYQIDAWMRVIQRESGGNPGAVNNWDSNAKKGTPSIGLVQTIGPTFEANKFPGHNDITNGYDDLLAGIHYMASKYGRGADAFARVSGPEGYADGGVISRHMMIEAGEGNQPEMMIPLDINKRPRALQLIEQTFDYMHRQDGSNRNDSLGMPEDKHTKNIDDKLNTLIGLFEDLLNINSDQVQAIKNQHFDRKSFYQQQARDLVMHKFQSQG